MTTDAESRYDVALSFAGAQRVYVALVADRLRSRGVRVFYDEFYATAMIGQELISYLQQVYSHQSKAVAAFISADWVQKPYTTHERETALAYALLNTDRAARPYLLPFRFDDTPVPGLQPTVAYHDLRTLRPGELRWQRDRAYKRPQDAADFLLHVLADHGHVTPGQEPTDVGVTVRFVWVSDAVGGQSVEVVPADALEDGEFEIDGVRYLLVPQELGTLVAPREPVPVFLREDYQAHKQEVVSPLPDSAAETAIVDQVRTKVRQLVDLDIARGAVPIGPTFTRTLPTPYGPAVVGTCIVARLR